MKHTLSVRLFFLFAYGEFIDTNSDDTGVSTHVQMTLQM